MENSQKNKYLNLLAFKYFIEDFYITYPKYRKKPSLKWLVLESRLQTWEDAFFWAQTPEGLEFWVKEFLNAALGRPHGYIPLCTQKDIIQLLIVLKPLLPLEPPFDS